MGHCVRLEDKGIRMIELEDFILDPKGSAVEEMSLSNITKRYFVMYNYIYKSTLNANKAHSYLMINLNKLIFEIPELLEEYKSSKNRNKLYSIESKLKALNIHIHLLGSTSRQVLSNKQVLIIEKMLKEILVFILKIKAK